MTRWPAARIKLGTNVLVLPPRNPVLPARELAAVDALPGGFVLIPLTREPVAWLRELHPRVIAPLESRGVVRGT